MNAGQDQQNRLYAVNLLNRAVNAWDARNVGIVAAVIAELEADVADLLNRYATEVGGFHSVAPGFVRTAAGLISEGRHRPELPPIKPASASLESNLKPSWSPRPDGAAEPYETDRANACRDWSE